VTDTIRNAQIDKILERAVRHEGVPGVVAAIMKGDELHVSTADVIAIGGSPKKRDTQFRISSMTKPITAAAVLAPGVRCRVNGGPGGWLKAHACGHSPEERRDLAMRCRWFRPRGPSGSQWHPREPGYDAIDDPSARDTALRRHRIRQSRQTRHRARLACRAASIARAPCRSSDGLGRTDDFVWAQRAGWNRSVPRVGEDDKDREAHSCDTQHRMPASPLLRNRAAARQRIAW
jgi:Beta-lactamase